MKMIWIVWMLAVGLAVNGQVKPATPTPEPNLPKFDLDFQGGLPSELVEALNKPLNGTLNVIIPDDVNNVMIPAMKLKDVNVSQVFMALQRASMKQIPYKVGNNVQFHQQNFEFSTPGVPTPTSVWAFTTMRRPQLDEESSYRFYQLGPYMEGLKIEDITTAIQTALKMLKIEPGPELKFHPETKLLIAVGKEADFALIDDVLKQLPKGASKAVRLSEVLVNGEVNKPGNIVLPKDQKLTILDAIGRAGGLMTGGSIQNKSIRFSRPGETERNLFFDDLKKENDPGKVIYLEPGDVIDVGRR